MISSKLPVGGPGIAIVGSALAAAEEVALLTGTVSGSAMKTTACAGEGGEAPSVRARFGPLRNIGGSGFRPQTGNVASRSG